MSKTCLNDFPPDSYLRVSPASTCVTKMSNPKQGDNHTNLPSSKDASQVDFWSAIPRGRYCCCPSRRLFQDLGGRIYIQQMTLGGEIVVVFHSQVRNPLGKRDYSPPFL